MNLSSNYSLIFPLLKVILGSFFSLLLSSVGIHVLLKINLTFLYILWLLFLLVFIIFFIKGLWHVETDRVFRNCFAGVCYQKFQIDFLYVFNICTLVHAQLQSLRVKAEELRELLYIQDFIRHSILIIWVNSLR